MNDLKTDDLFSSLDETGNGVAIFAFRLRQHQTHPFYAYIMNVSDDLISFEDEDYTNAKRIRTLERSIAALSDQLNRAFDEISSLRAQLYDHVNNLHDSEVRSRFTIHRIPNGSSTESSSSDTLLIEI